MALFVWVLQGRRLLIVTAPYYSDVYIPVKLKKLRNSAKERITCDIPAGCILNMLLLSKAGNA